MNDDNFNETPFDFINEQSKWPMAHILTPYIFYVYFQDTLLTLFLVLFSEVLETIVFAILSVNIDNLPIIEENEIEFNDEGREGALIGDFSGGVIGVIIGFIFVRTFTINRHWSPQFFLNNDSGYRLCPLCMYPSQFFGYSKTCKNCKHRRIIWIHFLQFVLFAFTLLIPYSFNPISWFYRGPPYGHILSVVLFILLFILFYFWNTNILRKNKNKNKNKKKKKKKNKNEKYFQIEFYINWAIISLILLLSSFITILTAYFIVWISSGIIIILLTIVYYIKKSKRKKKQSKKSQSKYYDKNLKKGYTTNNTLDLMKF